MEPKPSLLHRPGFAAVALCQSLLSFNDHAYKVSAALLAATWTASQGPQAATALASAGFLFVLPYLLFSGYAGLAADRLDRRQIVVATKSLELVSMLGAALAFEHHSLTAALAGVFLMGTLSTWFQPARSAMIPQLVGPENLSRANGVLDMLSYAAIVAGTAAGTVLAYSGQLHPGRVPLVLASVAAVGVLASLFVPRQSTTQAANTQPDWFPWTPVLFGLRRVGQDRDLVRTFVGTGCFWCFAALMQMAVLILGQQELHTGQWATASLPATLALSIAAGSLLAGLLSGKRVELGLIPFGCLAMALGAVGVWLATGHLAPTLGALALMGLGGGLFIVPLDAFLQHRVASEERGRVVAAANFTNSVMVLLASGLLVLLHGRFGIPVSRIVAGGGFLCFLGGIYAIATAPAATIRFTITALVRMLYRIEIIGAEHIPATGGALLVSNHVSFIDGFLIAATTPRMIRFLVNSKHYDQFHWLMRTMDAIPVSFGRPRDVLEMIAKARQELANGQVVCLFPEGNLTHTGNLMPFQRGLERIAAGLDVPVVPIYLHRVWGSIFSFKGGKFFWKWPARLPYPVTVAIGEPMRAPVIAMQARQAVQEMGALAACHTPVAGEQLHLRFFAAARKFPRRIALADTTGKQLSYFETSVAAILLARRLRLLAGERIGVVLPASVGSALVNLAAPLAGKVPVNLNFTVGREALASARTQCGIECVVTSRAF